MSPSHPLAQSESLTPVLAQELQGHITIVVEDSARVLNQGGDGLAGCGHRLVVPGFRQALNCAEQGFGVYGACQAILLNTICQVAGWLVVQQN